MTSASLTDKFAAQAVPAQEFAGALTPVSFGNPAQELAALRSRTGVYDLSWRGKLILTGADRVRWLNGMVTNNIRDLPADFGNYSFLLNAQGRIQGDAYIYNRGDYLLLASDLSQLAKIKEIADKYIIMDDVEVTDVSNKLASIGLTGPTAHEVLARLGVVVPVLSPGQIADLVSNEVGFTLVRATSEEVQSFEIWLSPENAPAMWDALTSAGATPVGTQALEWFRFLQGIPRYGQDIRDRDLPQETNQMRALHFSKGCYIGQEIVERIRARGAVHRTFAGFELSGAPPVPGTKVTFDGKEVGEITSAASIPLEDGPHAIALGYIRKEASLPGTEVRIGDQPAHVSALPFKL